MLNRALRTQNIDILIKMSLFLYDTHRNIEQLHLRLENKNLLTAYYEQGMNFNDFEKIEQKKFSQQVLTKKYNYLHLQKVLHNLLILLEFFFKLIINSSISSISFLLLLAKLSCFYNRRRNSLFNVCCFFYLSN
jgi:hypothetical protein